MSKINKMLQAVLLMCLWAVSAACSDKDEYVEEVNFVVEHDALTFMKEASSYSLLIKSPVAPQVTCGAAWVDFSLEKLTATIYQLNVAVGENKTSERTADITIISGDQSRTLTVDQKELANASPYEVRDRLGLGMNLGNHMDAYKNYVADELCDTNVPITQELFDKIKAAGFSTLRIPVTWIGHIGPAPDYEIDGRLERVAEIVGYAEKAGLNIIINIHHDGSGGYSSKSPNFWLDFMGPANSVVKNAEVEDQFRKVWTQIANRFVDTGDFLIFEAMNEIHDGDWGWGANLTDGGHQYELVNEWNQVFVDAVRATGGKNRTRYLAIPGYCGGWELVDHLKMPKDPTVGRLMLTVHCYAPGKFNQEFENEDGELTYYPEWGHTAAEDKKQPGGEEEEDIYNIFHTLQTNWVDKGYPVYIGEWTCCNRPAGRESAFRDYYLEFFCKAAHDCGMTPIFWDNNGPGVGPTQGALFNRATGELIQQNAVSVPIMVRAVTDKSADYTLRSVWDRAPAPEAPEK